MITYDTTLTPSEYLSLRKSVGWEKLSDQQATRGVKNTTFVVTARDDGRAVGMGRVLFDYGYTAYIGDIIIRPDYQRKGIGKRIVEQLIQTVLDAADAGDYLMFILGAAKGKEAFYKQFGFVERPNDSVGAGMTLYLRK